ncbi:hypothetical protein BH10BAC3_BH10BAC3_00950 [soil metagenome]
MFGRQRRWLPTTPQQFNAAISPHDSLLVSSQQRVIDKILYEHELFHPTRFLAQINVSVMPHKQLMHSIELFGNVVAPVVRKALQPAFV